MILEYNLLKISSFIFLLFFTVFFFTKGIHYFLKNPRYQGALAKTFIILTLAILCAFGMIKSLEYSDKLSDMDESNELTTINAAYHFAEKGFTSNSGLPDFTKSYYYVDRSNNNDKLSRVPPSETPKPRPIYTHQPPGPYWLTGLFVKICGNGSLTCPRILSTITSSLALLFFAIMIYFALGPLKSAVLMFFVVIIPMTSNMIWVLHYHNHTFSLFLIQTGFLLYFFKKKMEFKISTAIILFILGFVQGWFAFEYFFLISLSPISFALLYSQLDEKKNGKRLFFVMLFPVMGFCSAFALHFIQNSMYFGSFMEAVIDLFGRGRTRMFYIPKGWAKIDRFSLSLEYFLVYPRSWSFFIINFPILLIVCLVLIWFKDINITIKEPININLKWASPRRNYFVILTAFLASYLWIFTMFNHVANENPHMPRILFFFYFICILTILECIKLDTPRTKES